MANELLVAEIGSTTTVVSAFAPNQECLNYLGQGQAPTSVEEGDVNIGLEGAQKDLEEKLGRELNPKRILATSSAAGGLKMSVHGLVYDMTVKAAREAALGAGAVVRKVTAGALRSRQLKEVKELKPNIILLAGGVDYGEENVIIQNAEALAELELGIPIIYAGNQAIKEEVSEILEEGGYEVLLAENVYPEIDTFNIEPTRRLIQQAFEKHITKGPGMGRIREMVEGTIMPTPGAVMEAAGLLEKEIGDLMVIDVGGATTDVHSVTEGSPEIQDIMVAPEPRAKRTVEGDLGVFINAGNVIEAMGREQLEERLGFKIDGMRPSPIPRDEKELRLLEELTRYVVEQAVFRHAGKLKEFYGPSGKTTLAQGKDLTRVQWIIGTGGSLTSLEEGPEILGDLRKEKGKRLLPRLEARVLIDQHYLLAALGVLSRERPKEALMLMQESLGLD